MDSIFFFKSVMDYPTFWTNHMCQI